MLVFSLKKIPSAFNNSIPHEDRLGEIELRLASGSLATG